MKVRALCIFTAVPFISKYSVRIISYLTQAQLNLAFNLEDDSTTRFLDWRKKMNGTDNSNMVKIDAALGEKANSSVAVNTTLLASAWIGVEAPYTQELTVTGLTALQNGTISVAHSATAEQREIAREAMLSVIGQEDGKLTIAADGEMPEFDIPVYIILLG